MVAASSWRPLRPQLLLIELPCTQLGTAVQRFKRVPGAVANTREAPQVLRAPTKVGACLPAKSRSQGVPDFAGGVAGGLKQVEQGGCGSSYYRRGARPRRVRPGLGRDGCVTRGQPGSEQPATARFRTAKPAPPPPTHTQVTPRRQRPQQGAAAAPCAGGGCLRAALRRVAAPAAPPHPLRAHAAAARPSAG